MKLKDTPNATFSQELADGQLDLGLQGGQMTDPFGQEALPVSHSAALVSKKAKTTSATCFPHGLASSASAALQQSLESRLRQQLPTGGLTMFIKGWKQKVTPSGRRYCQLAASVRPINETDYGLWPTPVSNDDNKTPAAHLAMKARMKGGARHTITSLQVLAKALWPTPTARDHMPAHSAEYVAEKKAQGHGMANLNDVATLWTTPSSRDWKDTAGMVAQRKDGKSRNDQLPRQAFGQQGNGGKEPMAKLASLNPAFPCWLMGFSTAALSSMHLAMQSFRKSRRNS